MLHTEPMQTIYINGIEFQPPQFIATHPPPPTPPPPNLDEIQ